MKRIGLLGGSFDPVHFGHLRAAEWAVEAFSLDEVRLMPAQMSPFKESTIAAAADRLEMVRRAVADNPSLRAEAMELERPAPSYTVETLRALGSASADRFVLILGSDAAAGFDSWREAEEIRRLAEIVVLARPGEPARAKQASFPGLAVSATQIRELVRARRSIRYLTPEPVRLYIEEKGLYT
jgi:nicotinate-nucleotide adenylyltransferase